MSKLELILKSLKCLGTVNFGMLAFQSICQSITISFHLQQVQQKRLNWKPLSVSQGLCHYKNTNSTSGESIVRESKNKPRR